MSRRHGAAGWLTCGVALVLVVALAGCGVADSGGPTVDGTPHGVLGSEHGEPERLPPLRPEDASDSKQTVEMYFQAASSEWGSLGEYVKPFLSEPARRELRGVSRIRVVRLTKVSDPEIVKERLHRVRVKGQIVGELTSNGILLPAHGSYQYTFQLHYTRIGGGTEAWLIDNPPPGFVLSTAGIEQRFDALPVYYSNPGLTASLVPDIRYLPRSVERGKQRNLLVDWLLQSASPWLGPVAARTFPEGTQRRGNVYVVHGRDVVVNLSSEAEPYDRKDLLLAQLLWTLRPRISGGLQLRIEGRPISVNGRTTQPRDTYLGFDAVQSLPSQSLAYYVADGKVQPLPSSGVPKRLPPVLRGANGDQNRSVRSAALSRSGDIAALVRSVGGRMSLWVGRAGASSGEAAYRQVSGLPSKQMGRPVWVGSSSRELLLVVAAGRVYEVDLGDLRARKVHLAGESGTVTALTVAPDGFRAALVVDHRVYVAAVPQKPELSVTAPWLVTDRISAVDVAWGREGQLVVAGTGPSESGLWQVSLDGLQLTSMPTPVAGVPEHVAGYPRLETRGRVLVEEHGRVYEIYSTTAAAPGDVQSPPEGGMPFFAT